MGRIGVVAAAVTGLLALAAPSASSRAQTVSSGNVLSARGSPSLDYAYALAIQRNGRLVVAGRSAHGSWRFALARYTPTGKLDPSFGSGGKVLTAFGSRGRSWASALAVQPDGKLVAAGPSRVTVLSDDFAVGRYTVRGKLDPSFGSGGKVLTDFGSRKQASSSALALAIQADGKIVTAGRSAVGERDDFALARYTARGKLDPGFGRGGRVLTKLGSDGGDAWAVAIQPDGKIVAAGNSGVGDRDEFGLARYTARGKLDPSFGRGGTVVTEFGSWGEARAVAIQADGKIVVVGQSGFSDFALARYTVGGKLDPSFGSGGKVLTNFGSTGFYEGTHPSDEEALAVAMQADGQLVVTGSSDAGAGNERAFALARYSADGSLDPSFGNGGKVLTHFFSGSSYAEEVGIQADGKIVAAGGGAGYFDVARYTAEGKLDPSFGSGGKVVTEFRKR